MDRFSSRLRLVGLVLIGFSLLIASSVSRADDPKILFTEAIIHDIDILKDETEASDMPEQQSQPLKNRMEISKFYMGEGIDTLQEGDEAATLAHFKDALDYINRYLKLLSDKVVQGLVSASVAAPLTADA